MLKNRTAILLAILALLTALTYANSLQNGFVWDDNDIIVGNMLNRDLANAGTLFKSADIVFADDQRAYYRPLNRLTYMLDYQMYGLNPLGYHAENILLHILTVIALFFVAFRVTGQRKTAFVAALLFALHPVNAEAVNFISGGRNTILATLFTLLALLAWERGRDTGRGSFRWLAGAFFFLGLLSKETAFMLFPFLVVHDLTTKAAGERGLSGVGWCRNSVPFLLATITCLALRTAALSGIITGPSSLEGLWTRLMQLAYIIPSYAVNILFPVRLCSYYIIPRHFQGQMPILFAGCVLLIIVIVLLVKPGRPATRFGLLWLAINFIPIAQIIPIPSAAMADRYLYLPAIGLWLMAADGITALADRPSMARKWPTGALILAFVALAAMSWQYNSAWKDDITLNSRILRVEPDSEFAHYNLGGAYKTRGDLEDARSAWERAVELSPRHSRALNQLGSLYIVKGAMPRALGYLDRAVSANPNNAEAHYNRGIALERLGRAHEAVEAYRNFLLIIPTEHYALIPIIQAKIADLSQSPRKE